MTNTTKEKSIFIVAGEPSGDMHGANLTRELKKLCPDLKVTGLGGSMMKEAGAEIIYDLTSLAVIGIVEVLAHIKKFRRVFNMALDYIDQNKPDAVILIDYPGFNLKLAAEVKKRKTAVIYYISPQVWAWAKNRAKTISRLVDKMLVIFEFEKDLYKQYGLSCDFVGHPLLDMVKTQIDPAELRRRLNIPPENKIICLMPGSRKNEVKYILPVMLRAGQIIVQKTAQGSNSRISFLLLSSPYVKQKLFKDILDKNKLSVIQPKAILQNNYSAYDCLQSSSFALVASGTATLETAINLVPMAVIYKVNACSWPVLKLLVKLPYISLVNIVAGGEVVKEFLQYEAQPAAIAQEALRILTDETYRDTLKNNLQSVKEKLGRPGASRRASEIILQTLSSPKK